MSNEAAIKRIRERYMGQEWRGVEYACTLVNMVGSDVSILLARIESLEKRIDDLQKVRSLEQQEAAIDAMDAYSQGRYDEREAMPQ